MKPKSKPRKGSIADACQRIAPVVECACTLARVAHDNEIAYKEVATLLRAAMTRLAKDEPQ